ncbi:tetratricopeptide repeat protein [Acidobacteriota bacterium]
MRIKTIIIFLVCLTLVFCASPEKKMQKQQEKSPQYQYNLGLFYLNNGKPEEAVKYFQISLSLDKEYHLSYNGLGIAYLMMRELEKSAQYFERCLELNPTLTEAHNYLGTVYQELGHLEKAEQEFRTAIADLNYKSRDLPYYNLARLYFGQNRFADSLYYVQKSLEFNKRLVMAINLKGVIYERLEDYEAAIDSYKQGLKIAEEDINLKFNLGVAYFKNNQFDEAKEMFKKIQGLADLNMKRQIDGYMKIINKQ